MADDAARHISQAKRFRRSLATVNNVVGLTDRRVAIETRTARLKLAAAVAACSPGAVASFRLAALRTCAPSISRGMSMRPRVLQARGRIEAAATLVSGYLRSPLGTESGSRPSD